NRQARCECQNQDHQHPKPSGDLAKYRQRRDSLDLMFLPADWIGANDCTFGLPPAGFFLSAFVLKLAQISGPKPPCRQRQTNRRDRSPAESCLENPSHHCLKACPIPRPPCRLHNVEGVHALEERPKPPVS